MTSEHKNVKGEHERMNIPQQEFDAVIMKLMNIEDVKRKQKQQKDCNTSCSTRTQTLSTRETNEKLSYEYVCGRVETVVKTI